MSIPNVFWRAVRDALSLPAWVVACSLLGVGSLAHDAGFPAGAAVLSSVLIWAGPGQAIFFAGIAAGTTLPAVALAICLSSIRLLPMAVSVLPLLRRPGQGVGTQVVAAHFIAVTVWIESLRRLPSMPPSERLPYFFGFGTTCLVLSTAATYVGYFLVDALPLALAAGLLFMTPVFFTVSLVASARARADWAAILLGFALTPVSIALIGKNADLLATGLVGGTAAYGIGRLRRRDRRPLPT